MRQTLPYRKSIQANVALKVFKRVALKGLSRVSQSTSAAEELPEADTSVATTFSIKSSMPGSTLGLHSHVAGDGIFGDLKVKGFAVSPGNLLKQRCSLLSLKLKRTPFIHSCQVFES
mmetsp:Transcript_31595/g.52274  ORF Transcript_31595/g.52274 Transcript_31595/m.52274 type:complete len:117 (-) Transcript_31595:235-585(-)